MMSVRSLACVPASTMNPEPGKAVTTAENRAAAGPL